MTDETDLQRWYALESGVVDTDDEPGRIVRGTVTEYRHERRTGMRRRMRARRWEYY